MRKIEFVISKPVERKTKKSGDYQEEDHDDEKNFDVFFDGRNKSTERLLMVKSKDGRVYEVLTRVGPKSRQFSLLGPKKAKTSFIGHSRKDNLKKIKNFFKSNKKPGDYFDSDNDNENLIMKQKFILLKEKDYD